MGVGGVVVWGCGGVWVCGCGGVGVVSPCVRTFQGLHSVRLWTPTIYSCKFLTFFLRGSSRVVYQRLFINTGRYHIALIDWYLRPGWTFV
jgi:hypothetical protein